jgi:hypothetical protein
MGVPFHGPIVQPPPDPRDPEKAEIAVEGPDELYRGLRVMKTPYVSTKRTCSQPSAVDMPCRSTSVHSVRVPESQDPLQQGPYSKTLCRAD